MKTLYVPSTRTIGKYRALTLDVTSKLDQEREKMLSGYRGWIFEAGPGRLGVVTVVAANSEKLKYYDYSELEKLIKVIGYLPDQFMGAYYANNPIVRHIC